MRRTDLLIAVVLVAVVAVIASANVIGRDNQPPPPPKPPEHIIIPPKPMPPVRADAIDALLDDLEIGPADRHRELTIYPLRRQRGSARLHPLTFDEALRRGQFAVRERGPGHVNELEVRNDSPRDVFLMSGEVLTGAKQDRIFRDDVLVPRGSGWMPVWVYCVEQGRWTPVAGGFRSEKRLVPPALRQQAQMKAPQASIWEGVAGAATENAAPQGATKRFNDIYSAPNVSGRLSAYRDHYVPMPWGRTVGVVVFSGGRVLGADIFSDPDLFAELWPKVLDSYVLDARRSYRPSGGGTDAALAFLRGARSGRASREPVPTPGAGEAVRITGETSGSALTYRGEAIHVNLYGAPVFVPLVR